MMNADLKKYFWDIDVTTLNAKKHKQYILERLLDIGDETAVRWLQETFSRKDIIRTLNTSRKISEKSLNFWKLLFVQRIPRP